MDAAAVVRERARERDRGKMTREQWDNYRKQNAARNREIRQELLEMQARGDDPDHENSVKQLSLFRQQFDNQLTDLNVSLNALLDRYADLVTGLEEEVGTWWDRTNKAIAQSDLNAEEVYDIAQQASELQDEMQRVMGELKRRENDLQAADYEATAKMHAWMDRVAKIQMLVRDRSRALEALVQKNIGVKRARDTQYTDTMQRSHGNLRTGASSSGQFGVATYGFKPGKHPGSPPGRFITATTLYRRMRQRFRQLHPGETPPNVFLPGDDGYIEFDLAPNGAVIVPGDSNLPMSAAYVAHVARRLAPKRSRPFQTLVGMKGRISRESRTLDTEV